MIDIPKYKKLHPNSSTPFAAHLAHEEMNPEIMALASPPSEPELLLFPLSITGYNLRRKKWGIDFHSSSAICLMS